jgi:hypothetical protein
LLILSEKKTPHVRFRIGRCWLIIIRINGDILVNNFEKLFSFFYENLLAENYEMNFTAAEFFLYLVDDEEDNFVKNTYIFSTLQNNLKQ